MKYDLVIFDMDGTILNTLEDLTDTMNYCLEKYNMPQKSLVEIRSYVGNGIQKLIERAVPSETDSKLIDAVCKTFNVYYKGHCAIKTRPYDGICEVISALKSNGIKTAVVSNKPDYAVKSLCEDYFSGLFDYAVGDKTGMRRKPYPDGVNKVMNHFGISPDKTVYIGDSDVDYRTAQNAGIDVIMVGWGFKDEDFLYSIGAKQVIHEPEQLPPLIIGTDNR